MAKLTKAHLDELAQLMGRPPYGSSCRVRDGLRKTLKRLGMIRFDRATWQWEILPAGRAALKEQAR